MFRILPKNQKPLSPRTNTESLVEEWKSVCMDKTSDLSDLCQLMRPALQSWTNILRSGKYYKDINIYTLSRLLSPSIDISNKMIDAWIAEVETTSSLLDELTLLFIERVRAVKYIPRAKSDLIIEYVIARDLKLALKDKIIQYWDKRIDLCALERYYSSNFEYQHYDKLPDYYLLNIIKQDYWMYYLCCLIYEGYTSVQRSDLTKIKRQNLYREEKQLWHLLRSKL